MLLPPRGAYFHSQREHKTKIERKQKMLKNCLFLISSFFNNHKKRMAGFHKQQFLLLFYIKMR